MLISDLSSDVCSSDLRNKLLDAVDLPTNGKHRAEGQHIVLRLIAVAVMRVRIDPQARHARAAHCLGQAGLRVSDEVKLLAGVKAGFGEERQSVVSGKSVSVRVGLGGRRMIQQKKK